MDNASEGKQMKSFKGFISEVAEPTGDLKKACWKGYTAVGMKMKNGRKVPNCVPVKEAANAAQQAAIAIAIKKAGKKPKNEEVSPMIKPPNGRFDNKSDAFAHVKKHGGKVYKGTYIDPNNGTKHISFHVKEEARRPTDAEYEHAKKQVQKTFGNDRRIHAIGVIGDRIHLKHGTKNATDMKGVSMRLPEEVEQLDERGEDSKGYKRSTESGAGLTRKGAKHFGIKTAVTTPPSKLKKGSKAWNRRKSFCARMGGMKGPMKDSKGRPTRKAMSLRRWHCEE